MGSLAVAPSNDNIVYGGTGEGHLSGDSYFGNGVLKSTDGGNTWTHVSGDYFRGVAISRIVVDPANADSPLRRGAPRPRRRAARHPGRPLPVRHLGVEERRRLVDAAEGGDRGQRRDGSRDGSAEHVDPVRLVLGRRDLQEHERRRHLGPDHERHPGLAGAARREPDAILDRDLPPGRLRRSSLRRLRLGGRHRLPPVAGLQVGERGDQLVDAPEGLAARRTTSRTTAAASASTTT